jgi:hypothetical protein
MVRTLLLVALVALVAACGNSKRQRRSSDAGVAVEPIKVPVFANDAGGKTKSADEVEPNDSEDSATALPLGGTVHGRIESDTDVDHYKLDVTAAGALALELSAVDGNDLTLELHDATGALVATSNRGGAKVKEGLPNFSVVTGRYTAVVRRTKITPKRGQKKPPAIPVLPYDITAQVAPIAANAEREPDEDRGTANDLIPGDPVSGYIGWQNDTDVWKLSLEAVSAKNALEIELGPVDGIALALEIADGVGQVVMTRKAPRGVALVVRGFVPVVPAGTPPFHYLTIKASASNPEAPYQLRAKASNPEPDAEVEPNDSPDKPMAIPEDRTTVDGHWSPGDVDCYAIPADPAARTVDISIETPPEADLSAELVVDGKSVAKSDAKGKGAAEKVSGPVPANGHAILKIRGNDAGGEGRYSVKVSEGPAKP